MIDPTVLADTTYYTSDEVADFFGITVSALRKRILNLSFPRGRKLAGQRQHVWTGRDIKRFIEKSYKAHSL